MIVNMVNFYQWKACSVLLALLSALSVSVSADEKLQMYIDGVIESTMKDHNIAGLTLGVVADDEIKALKGYGYADLKSRVPVDPETHLFRIASVSKTFTATAIMQLVEEGKIDLDADVNDYLTAFKIPATFDTPITIKDLLSHRAGFEEAYGFVFAKNSSDFGDLESLLVNSMPERIFASGTVTNYSNYGAALAGYIVQEVSGLAYEDYLEAFIFRPLAMSNTSAKQPLYEGHSLNMSEQLQAQLATTYLLKGDRHIEAPFELTPASPASSVSSTAADMSRYMLAHLNYGELNGARILRQDTARQMQKRLYPGRPGPDFTHGFRSGTVKGYKTLEHGGATYSFFSSMVMIPELGIGVFISVNGANSRPSGPAARLILEKMIQKQRSRPATISMSDEQAKAFTGKYMINRRAYSNGFKLFNLTNSTINTVIVSGRDSLMVAGRHYERIGSRSFLQLEGTDVIIFELDNLGRAVRFYHPYGHVAYDRLSSESNPTHFWVAVTLVIIAALAHLVMAWRRRLMVVNTRYERWALSVATLAALFVLLTFGLSMVSIKEALSLGSMAQHTINVIPTTLISLTHVVAFIMSIAAVLVLLGVVPVLGGKSLTIRGKIYYIIFVLLLINMVVNFINWNMI